MTVASTSQKTARDALGTLLQAALTGSSNPVQAAFGYDVATFQGQSPVCVLKSGKVDRTQMFVGQSAPHVWFWFDLEVYVAVGDANSPTWTDTNVEDTHNTVEKLVTDVLANNLRTVQWDMIQYAAAASAPMPKLIAGSKYRMRTISIKCRVIGG